jgi:gliding motility-associated-like protein
MKKIFTFLFLGFIFYSYSQGDNCATAYNLGTLPTPAGCSGGATGVGLPVTHNGTNVGATAANPYVSIIDCGTGTADMASPAQDVWYSFVASGPTAVISFSNITGSFGTPQIGLYTGSCNSLTPAGCDVDGSPATFTGMVAGQTYYIQVSGNGATAAGNFTISVQSNQECGDCLTQASLVANPPPVNGYYYPGQTVTFCYTVFTYNQVNTNWFHGVQLTYGAGWNMVSQSPPAGCSSGSWVWKPAGIGVVNGTNWGPGFYFESNLGCNNCDVTDPGDNYGDANASNCDLQFCWTMQVDAACPASSLNVTVNTSGDGESGSWTNLSCQGDSPSSLDPNMSCCLPPTMASTPTTCSNSTDGTATATATGTVSPWDFYWYNSSGTLVGSTMNTTATNTLSNIPAGTYTVVVIDNSNCSIGANVTVSSSPGATVTVPANISVCNGATVNASNFTSSGFPSASYTWTNTNAAIGIPISGTGNISSFTATNTGLTPITGTITVTPYSGPDPATSCAGAPSSYTITVNPSPQVTLTAAPSTTICSGQTVILTGNYIPQPVVSNQTFQNGTVVNIPNGCSGPLGCQFGTSSVNSTGITPVNFVSGQLVSICFTLRHEDYTEFTTLTLQVGSTVYTSQNPAPAPSGGLTYVYNADMLTLLNQIKATIQTGGNNSAQVATFCIPQSVLTLIEAAGGLTNTTWKIGISDQTGGADNGSILDFTVIIKDFQLFNYSWASSNVGSISTSPLSGTTNGGALSITAFPTTTSDYTLSILDESGCPGTATVTITVASNIVPTFVQLGPYCQNATAGSLNSTSLNGITGTWSPSVINTSTLGSSNYVFTPNAGQCAVNTTMTVQITTPVTPSFTQLGPYCQNSSPGSLPSSSDNGISGTWSPSTISTTTLGSSTYTFTPSAGLCATTQTMTIAISTPVTPSFVQLGPYCQNDVPGTLSSTSTNGITGTWNPSSINTSNTGNVTYTFTPTAGVCATTQTMTVNISTPVNPTFSQLGPYCQNDLPGTLSTSSTNGITGTWSPSSINTANAGNVTYTFTPTAGVCATSTTSTITTNALPTFTAALGTNPSACGLSDGTILISGLSVSSNYTLNYNDGSVLVGPIPTTSNASGEILINGLNAGNYSNFSISDANCSSTISGPITLIDPNAPVFSVSLGNNPTTCLGTDGAIILNGLTPNTTYTVTYSDGITVVGPNSLTTNASGSINLGGLNSGNYSDFVVELLGCIGSQIGPVNLTDPTPPNLIITSPAAVCQPNTVDLTTSNVTTGSTGNGALTYWTDQNATNQLSNPTSVSTTGTYYIQSTANGCTDIEAVTVIINSTPSINNPGNQAACASYSLPVIAGSDLSGSQGYFNNSQALGGTAISGLITSSQTVYIYDANGACSDEESFVVTINPLPSATISGGATYCQGDAVSDIVASLSGTANFTLNYTLDGVAQSQTGSSSSLSLGNTAGTYVLVSITDANCTNSNLSSSQTIVINPIPNAPTAGTDTLYCNNAVPVDLFAQGTGSFTWYADQALTTVLGTNSSYTPSMNAGSTNYFVTETINGCEGPASMVVVSVEECEIIVPTAFTPDGDLTNDVWILENIDQIYPENVVSIYNRWGSLIYQSKAGQYETNPWDGTFKSEKMPVGSYYFIIEYNDNFTENKTGIVTLINN